MSLLSPKKDTKLKSPAIQNKVSKVSPMSTSRGANLVANKGSPSYSRQSPTSVKAPSEKQATKGKIQNTSIKDLEQKLGQLGTILANIKTQPDKKQSPTHKQKQILKPQLKKNSSAVTDKKMDSSSSSNNNQYRKQVVRKTCPDIVKAFETSKMLLNPSELINPRMTADKNDKAKMNKVKSPGDPYQLIDLTAGSRKSFKINNLETKKLENKLENKLSSKKTLKSNEHAKNLTSLQKQQAKMRATMSNNLLPKHQQKKEALKTFLDESKSQNKTMEESAQSLPGIQNKMKMSMIKDKKNPIEVVTSASLIPGSVLKDELMTLANRLRISPPQPELRKVQECETKITEFQMLKSLGLGKFSEVFLAVHKSTGLLFAIKAISKEKVKKFNMVKQVTDQIKIHSSLNHPNIIKFYGLLQDYENLYLILEFVEGGSLFDLLTANETVSVKLTTTYLRDVISAIQYLHEKSIAHRDIKPENILIGMGCVAKICDLGWSAVILTSRKTYCGTFDYVPPEILQKKDYDLSVDIWCLGVLTYELLIGRVPYEGDKHTVVMSKINNAEIPFPKQSQQFPLEAKSYIQWLLQHNPQERPKSKQLLDHKFFELAKQEPVHFK